VSPGSAISRFLRGSPLVAAVLYAVAVGLFVTGTYLAVGAMRDGVYSLEQATQTLEQLQSRDGRSAPAAASNPNRGNPLLDGPSLTVAGASLLQRVNAIIVGLGGSVQSSQVDAATLAKEDTVSLLINCELEQSGLQKLLFSLETSTPFVFVDQLDIQAPPASNVNDNRPIPLRVTMNISARWQGMK
jgi:general secretion pathway protein M